MKNTMWDLEIKMIIPFDLIITYPDDFNDDYIIDPYFKKIMDRLKIKIDIPPIINDLHRNRGKNSSVSVYFSLDSFSNFIIIDTDIEPSDQLDLIVLCIRCKAEVGGEISKYAHDFYTSRCKYNVHYAEGNFEIRGKYKVDFSLYNPSFNYENIITGRNINLYQDGKLIRAIKMK